MGNVTDFETGTAELAIFHNGVLYEAMSVPGRVRSGLTSIYRRTDFRLRRAGGSSRLLKEIAPCWFFDSSHQNFAASLQGFEVFNECRS
jgi:hypothetical protein